jgi:hypothetical protein
MLVSSYERLLCLYTHIALHKHRKSAIFSPEALHIHAIFDRLAQVIETQLTSLISLQDGGVNIFSCTSSPLATEVRTPMVHWQYITFRVRVDGRSRSDRQG